MNEIKAVISDCDGTLVESEFLSNEVLSAYAAEFGLEITAREATELFSGGQMANSLQVLESRLGQSLPKSFVPEFRRRQAIVLRERLQPIDGAHDLLARLTRPFCLASNAPLDKCELISKSRGLTASSRPIGCSVRTRLGSGSPNLTCFYTRPNR